MRFADFVLLEDSFNRVFYHGTPAENVSNILAKGLRLHKPQDDNLRAIYFTTDFELAAKYGVGAYNRDIPAVLEVVISKPKRLRSMSQDPLDQTDVAWEYETMETPGSQDLEYFKRDVQYFIRNYIPYYWVKWPDRLDELGTHALNGFDIYRFILGTLERNLPNFPVYKQQIKVQMLSHFKPGKYSEDLNITPSGTFQVKPDFYSKWEQTRYPKHVPPSAIKYIWVRKNDFPNARGRINQFGIKYLPWQARDILEEKENLYSGLADELETLEEELEQDDFNKEWWIKTLQRYVEQIMETDEKEFKDDIEAIIQSLYDEEPVEDLASLVERVRGYADSTRNEEWGNEMVFGHTDWVRVHPSRWKM